MDDWHARLRHRRRELGLTQQEVAARLGRRGVSTSNRALSTLEHGGGIDVGKLPDLADALECTVTYLVGLTDDPQRWEPDGVTVRRAHSRVQPAPSLIITADVPDRVRP